MAMTGPFWSHNQRSNRLVLTLDERHAILDQQVAIHLELGWSVVERHNNPPEVRITNRGLQHGLRTLPAQTLAPEDRTIWVNIDGSVRMERND